MSFDELAGLIKTVFNLVQNMLKIAESRGSKYENELFPEVDYPAIAVETAKKAFMDLKVPVTSEINYQQFVQWTTGQNLYSDDELDALQRT